MALSGARGPALTSGWRERRTRNGARLTQHGVLLSELRATPGPTHTLFDVLAAAMTLAPGGRTLLLGFAGGSVVAPLRALGGRGRLDALDVTLAGVPAFRRVCGAFAGDVRVARAEAGAFLRADRGRYDVLVDDLSVPARGDVEKPPVSFQGVPALGARRLAPGGLFVANLLPTTGRTWRAALDAVAGPFAHALEVRFRDYVNRFVLAADRPLPARATGAALRERLRRLGSRQAERVSVHALARGPASSRAVRRRRS